MNKYLSTRYQNVKPSAFAGGRDDSETFHDLINFCIGDPDIRTHELIIKGAMDDSMAGMTNYTNPQGQIELREEICKFYKDEYRVHVSPTEVLVTTSGCHAMCLVMEAILDDGDEVIVPSPYFGVYKDQIKLARGVSVFVPTREEDDFALNVEDLKKYVTDKTKVIVLNTPNNPTGACLTREKMKEIYDFAVEKDLLIVADDIYTIYSFGEEFVPLMTFEEYRDRVITINSFSKDYVMTGWRIGNIIARKEFIEVMSSINEAMVFSAPTVSQRAALHALRKRHEIQPELTREFKERMFYAYERLSKLKNVRISEPKGTFYLFPNVTETGISSEEVVEKLLKEAHIKVLDGKNFGPGGDGHIRLAVTLGVDKMKEAFDRMEKMDIFK